MSVFLVNNLRGGYFYIMHYKYQGNRKIKIILKIDKIDSWFLVTRTAVSYSLKDN